MHAPRRIYALNAHATWACRHSGACCTAGWSIPVESERRTLLGAAVLEPDATGRCVWHDREAQRCRVHRDHGPSMLPSACFHFPRRALLDDRGLFVTLSHFCPTAATMLLQSPGSLTVVESPEAFPATREYDGLDGREAWPPLVKPNLLFDVASYSQWERFVLAAIDRAPEPMSAWDALRDVSVAAEHLRAWTPADGPLADRVLGLGRVSWPGAERDRVWPLYERYSTLEAFDRLTRCIPPGVPGPALSLAARAAWPSLRGQTPFPSRAARRYVAAKAFAAWTAYDAFGIRTMIAELALAALVLEAETARFLTSADPGGGAISYDGSTELRFADCVDIVRAADLLLAHLVDRSALMDWLRPVEHVAVPPPRPVAPPV